MTAWYARTCCPDCFEPFACKPAAREGRCAACRPEPRRRHSQPRVLTPEHGFVHLMTEHNNRLYTQ